MAEIINVSKHNKSQMHELQDHYVQRKTYDTQAETNQEA